MTGPARLPLAIALVAAATLAYQLLLMRWLAIAHWHPFAAVIISLALLGHGASGTLLSLWPGAAQRFERWFPAGALGFALSAPGMLLLAARIPFNGLELVWDLRQLGWLAALYLALSLPFLCAASCFGLAFARYSERIPRLYGADLCGAGLGALGVLALAWWLPVGAAVALVAALALLAACVATPRPAVLALAALSGLALLALALSGALTPPVNPYKGLAKALLVRDARVLAQRHGSHGWLAVLESPRVPLRQVAGLSLLNTEEPAPQLGLFLDGDWLGVVTRDDGTRAAHGYLRRTTTALPYALRPRARVLVLAAGGGQEVLQALAHGARTVRAVEANPQLVALLRGPYAGYSGGLYHDPRVQVRVGDARSTLRALAARADAPRYDLIVFGGAGSAAAGSAGAAAVAEDPLLTVEALGEAWRLLAPGGVLAVTRWEKQPPRDALKLFASAAAALREAGVRTPDTQLALVRNWDAGTLLLRRGPFPAAERARLRGFLDAHGFDPVYYPGMRVDEAAQVHALARDEAAFGTRALLSPRADAYLAGYKFDIRPARDDRPYFADFFRWRALPELWALREQGGAVLLDAGTLLLLAALAQALPLALLLVLAPLLALPRADANAFPRARAGAYFVCLGLAFLFVEIVCLARLKLVVGQDWPAIALGIGGFLVFAGLGSAQVQRRSHGPAAAQLRHALALIVLGFAWHMATFALLQRHGAGWPLALRAGLALATLAPLAFAMGRPFPLGLGRVARQAPAFVPWAWGLNGCASVVSALLALLLAVSFGLTATLLLALGLYLLAARVWRAD